MKLWDPPPKKAEFLYKRKEKKFLLFCQKIKALPRRHSAYMLTLVWCVYDDIGVLILMLKLACLQLLGNMYPASRHMEKEQSCIY